MSKISLSPDANGTGIFTIASPNSNTNRTLTLPDNAGTIQTQLDNGFSFRNRIINGDMRIDQRNAGASVTPADNAYTLDRWQSRLSQSSKYSVQQSSTAPAGYSSSLLVTSLSAYTVGASEFFQVRQIIEGFNVGDIGFGTASASSVTVSFWVRSSLTGSFGGVLSNADGDRSYQFSYTINSANTWEQKSVTIVGDTTGTWYSNTNGGFVLAFALGAGATVSGSTGSWGSTLYRSATGATSVVGTNGATFYITGVQLEVGSVATPFERRPYGTELSLCQRYYAKTYLQGTVPGTATYAGSILVPCFGSMAYAGGTWQLPVTMRANPTTVLYSAINGNTTGKITSDATDGNGTAEGFSTNVRYYRNNDSSGIGINTFLYFQGTASAEL